MPARASAARAAGRRAETGQRRVAAGDRRGTHAKRRQAEAAGDGRGRDGHGGGAIGEPARVAGGDRAAAASAVAGDRCGCRGERRREAREPRDVHRRARPVVARDAVDGHDLGVEHARGLRGGGARVRARGPGVLARAGDAAHAREVLGGRAHVGVGEAAGREGRARVPLAGVGPEPVRRGRRGLRAAGDDERGVAGAHARGRPA